MTPFDDALDPQAAHDAIRSMRVRGAANIGRTAAATLGRIAYEADAHDARRRLLDVGRSLISARPTAVTLRNGVNLTLDGLREQDDRDIVDGVQARAHAYIEASHKARDAIARQGAKRIPDGGAVLTHCHSSLVVATLLAAHEAGRRFRVFTDETRPWWQGRITAQQLAEHDVDVTLIVDSAAHAIMEHEDVGLVLTGADAVTADGSLYNKVGTRAVALGAHEMGVDFLPLCETHKLSPYSVGGGAPEVEERPADEVLVDGALPGVKVRNPVFDRTPPKYIKEFMTEQGPMASCDVGETIATLFGSMEGWL